MHNAAFNGSILLKQWLDDEFWLETANSRGLELLQSARDSCRRVVNRIISRLAAEVWKQVAALLKLYLKKNFIFSPSAAALDPSSELEDPLLLLKQHLGALSAQLAKASFGKVLPIIAEKFAAMILEQVLMKAQINEVGAKLIDADIKHIASVFTSFESLAAAVSFKVPQEAANLLSTGPAKMAEVSGKVDKLVRNQQMSDQERALALSRLCGITALTATQVLYLCNK